MCVLCSSGYTPFHWAEEPTAGAHASAVAATQAARRDRLARARVCGAVLARSGLSLRSATGRQYVVADRKGRVHIAQSLAEVWETAQRFGAALLDPLDPALLDSLTVDDA